MSASGQPQRGSAPDSAPRSPPGFLFPASALGSLSASLVARMVKNLPAVQETLVQSLGLKNPLEKGMSTHSSILAWKVP